jgi:sugar lactone lactonase YvrE
MPVRAGINNFNSGKWSPLLASRTDLDKRVAALKESVNFMSLPHGPIQTMPGSKYVDYANATEKLIPFIKDRVDNYMIKLTLGATAFYKDQAKLDVSEWDLATAVYSGKSKDVSAQTSFPAEVVFSPDGTKMYVLDGVNDKVLQYTLSTPGDVSTATYASKFKDISAEEGAPRGLTLSSDGTKMYICGSNNDTVYQYTLSTARDVSTATYASKLLSLVGVDNSPESLFFKPDGTKLYILGTTGKAIYQYALSTAWDVSTGTYETNITAASEESSPSGFALNQDGTKMYICGNATDAVYQYTLSTAWDVSTATYASKTKDVSSEDPVPHGITFSLDGTKMYISGTTNDTVYQYTVGYASNPYTNDGDLDDITYAQTGNELYLFHPKYPIKKITYYSDSVWALSDVVFDPPPLYLDYVDVVSAATATITLSATSGKYVTITPSGSGYRTPHSGDIGRGVSDGTGYGIIRAFSNQPTTLYVMEVIVPFRTTVYNHTNNQIWLIGSPFGEIEILGSSVEIGLSCVLSVSSDNQKAFELQGSAADVWTESATAGVYYLDNGSDEYARLPAGPVAPNNVGAKWMYFNKQGSLDRTTMERFEWGWGDDDTLGYDTIYIRIDGDADPDTLGSWELFAEIDHDKDVFTSADVGRYMVIHSGYIKIDTVNSAAEARGTI